MSLAYTYPLAHEIHAEQIQIAPFQTDGIDRVLNVMQHAYAVEGASEREALCRGLEQLRDEITPHIRGPRGASRPPSRKAKRRVCAALDHLIAEGRARNG